MHLSRVGQVQKLRQAAFARGWEGMKVGTTEVFQGQERRVIVVSTVSLCTGTCYFLVKFHVAQVRTLKNERNDDVKFQLGFLTNPKRLNVAISRAQELLVIVGDAVLLSRDQHWRMLLDYVKEHGQYDGPQLDYSSCSDGSWSRLEELSLGESWSEVSSVASLANQDLDPDVNVEQWQEFDAL